jgi:replicative DNA helicase
MEERMPPHNREAEIGVLGGILRDPQIMPDVERIVSAGSFYFDANQKIFRALSDLAADGKPIDAVALLDALGSRKQLADVGGAEYLADVLQSAATGASAEYHAKLVRDAALVRGLIHASRETLRDAYDGVRPAADLLAEAETRVMAVADGAPHDAEPVAAPELVRAFLERIDVRASGAAPTGFGTGFPDVDQYLCGVHPGQLVIVGARPGVGKTAFALALALHWTRAGIPTLLFSLEMPHGEIIDRAASARSNVPLSNVRAGKLSAGQTERLASAADQMRREPLFIDDGCALSAARMGAVVRRAVRRNGVRAVVVDYLQLLAPENPKENRTQQVGLMARRAKMTARACGVPLLVLSQLNREMENRPDAKPRLSDLRESGEIEQHADAVVFLAPQKVDPNSPVWPVDVIVAKNRNGPVGEVTIDYNRPFTRFENRKL